MDEKLAIPQVLAKARSICLCGWQFGKTFVVSSIASFDRLHLDREVEGEMGSACKMRVIVRLCMPVHAMYHPFIRRVFVSKRVLSWFKV